MQSYPQKHYPVKWAVDLNPHPSKQSASYRLTSHPMNHFGKLKEPSALDRAVWRKLDRWVLPVCAILFLLNAVDRTNIANARVAGFQTSLKLSNYQYTVALTVTYILYIVAVLPSTLILKRVGPDVMLPFMAVMWGVAASAQGLVHTYSGLLACRFFLGLTEGGLFPGIVLYLSYFYPRERLQIRIATFYASASLAGAFSGLLAAAIEKLNGKGGRPEWAWIFILEGIFTIVFGVVSFFLLPRSPEKAHFLTEKDREHVIFNLKLTGSVSEDGEKDNFSWSEVAKSIKSPHVWLLAVNFVFSGAILFGLVYFEPSIVAGLGYTGSRAQLMSVPPYAVTSVLSFISAIISDRYQCRGYTTIFFSILQVIGFSMYYASKSHHIRYVSLFFSVAGAFGSAPALIAWLANNSAPHTRRATATSVAFMSTELGAILATWLLGFISPAPNYTSAEITFLVMSIGMVVFTAGNLVYLRRENRLKTERQASMRKEDEPEGLGDLSVWFMYSL